jgi:hypothetical protein
MACNPDAQIAICNLQLNVEKCVNCGFVATLAGWIMDSFDYAECVGQQTDFFRGQYVTRAYSLALTAIC